MTTLFEFPFFWHLLTFVFSIVSVYVGDEKIFLVMLWSVFVVFLVYIWCVYKEKMPFFLFILPVFVISTAFFGTINNPALPLLFLMLPFVFKKQDTVAYFVFAAISFAVMVFSGDFSKPVDFVDCFIFVLVTAAVWLFSGKSFSFFVGTAQPPKPLKKGKISSSLVEDPFRPLKKYLVRTKNFDNIPLSLRLIELLPGGNARIYDSESEFSQKGLLFRVVHDKTAVAAKTLLAEMEDIPMMPEYNYRIYYPISLLDFDDPALFEPEYVLVVDIDLKGAVGDKDALIEKFSEIKDDVVEQLKQSETFSQISIEKQRNAALYRETTNIVDSFDHENLMKAAALAIFNLAPEAGGVFVAKKEGDQLFGYAFGVNESVKAKWPLAMEDIFEIARGEIKDPQSIHFMMVEGKIDDYYEASDIDKRKQEPLFQPEFDFFNKKSCIAIRLMVFKNDIKGTISVLTDTKKDFEKLKGHADSIRMISKVVTSAVNNIDLFKKMEDLSNIDGLTGLYNRRCFNNMIERKASEASRMKVPLSMIMLDIDHFKRVNDTYGHKAGDDVIRFISKTIKSSVRKVDFAARYGGEEFVVLLNNTTIDSAEKIAEKIRNLVRDSSVNADGVLLSVTASFGVSSYPEPSMSAGDLVKDADKALYYSKEHGRDQVTVFSKEI